MVTGVIGVTFWTDELEGMFDFYNNVLRLPLHSRHEDFIAFELGDVRFNIGRHSEVSGRSRDPFRFMPHLGVEDIHAEVKRLAAAGVEFIREPEQETWGGWVATFKDPDGNLLQLLQLV
ncbi:MAG: VOC family protein [Chloroflexota bacterium]|uniref:VOC domain-containing protein n=1 Tax=marine metagenome TaxID=408172 RepID=A0A381PG61_9ZZZZ|nr:VOC family protein [Chloroflexota bacterium]